MLAKIFLHFPSSKSKQHIEVSPIGAMGCQHDNSLYLLRLAVKQHIHTLFHHGGKVNSTSLGGGMLVPWRGPVGFATVHA